MACVFSCSEADEIGNFDLTIGPLVDDSAPCSAICETALCIFQKSDFENQFELELKPAGIALYDRFRYGKGDHYSAPQKIYGLNVIFSVFYNRQTI